MKRIILFTIFFLSINFVVRAQDTIVRTNGEKILCKIKREDSTAIFIRTKVNHETIDTYIPKSSVSSIIRQAPTVYPDFKDRNLVLKLDFIIPAIGIEARMGKIATCVISYQPGYLWIKENDDPTEFYIINQLRTSARFFYTVDKYNERGKRTDKFAGNFFSVFATFGKSTSVTPNYLTFGPSWGLQRNLGKLFQFSFEVGAGYTTAKNTRPFGVVTDLKLGFAL